MTKVLFLLVLLWHCRSLECTVTGKVSSRVTTVSGNEQGVKLRCSFVVSAVMWVRNVASQFSDFRRILHEPFAIYKL
jgi:hypothetical protein